MRNPTTVFLALAIAGALGSSACSDDESGNTGGTGGKGSSGTAGTSGSGGSTGGTGGSAGASGKGGTTAGGAAGAAGAPPCTTPAGPKADCYTCKQVIDLEECALPAASCGWDQDNPGPPGATRSAAKFFDLIVGCACNDTAANNCVTVCATVCVAQDFPTQDCQDCLPKACPVEYQACLDDDGTAAAADAGTDASDASADAASD